MTLPPVIRVFFAIELPEKTKKSLSRFISLLKKTAKTNAIRWTKPENLHITLQFLAEVQIEHLPKLSANVRQNLALGSKKLSINLNTVHLFPNPFRPRVIVLDLMPQEELAILASLIGEGIKASDYPVESRPFRGHLTLGRIKYPVSNLNFLSEIKVPEWEKIGVEEIVLFRSEPKPEGSSYTPLERIVLQK